MVKPGVLIISHGSPETAWIQLVDDAVKELKLPPDIPVEASFLEAVAGRGIGDGISTLESKGVTDLIVVPLFVSSGSKHIDEISYALGLKREPELPTELVPFAINGRVHFGRPMDDDPHVAAMLWDKLKNLSRDPSREAIVLVGHGSGHNGFRQRWEQGISSLASRVQELAGAAAADYALLRPDMLREKVEYWNRQNCDVIVAPVFLSKGYFTKKVIPERLKGLTYRYSGEALLPHPALVHWIRGQISTIMRSLTI